MVHSNSTLPQVNNPENEFTFRVEDNQASQRLDRFLCLFLVENSRSVITQAIKNKTVLVDGQPRKNSYKLKKGEIVTGYFPPSEPLDLVPEKMELDILFEDEHLIVISKAPDVVVHPGAGNHSGTLANGLLYHCNEISNVGDDALRPGIVHRLDKDTSGVMVIAKTENCHKKLSAAFKAREVKKQYTTLVHGRMKYPEGRLVASIGRHPVQRKKMAVREGNDGRYAATSFSVIKEYGAALSLIEVEIETGRTHQIRVHMQHLGNSVVGDSLYGPKRPMVNFHRQLLHASNLRFIHPESGRLMKFHAPLWPDFAEFLEEIEDQYEQEI